MHITFIKDPPDKRLLTIYENLRFLTAQHAELTETL